MALTVREHMTLALAAQRFRHRGTQEQAIYDTFTESPYAFWRRVDALTDDPEALREYPALVWRLQRLRELRRQARGAQAAS